MNRALAAVALLVAACEPSVRGRCTQSSDCRSGATCSIEGICIASSGQCAPACNAGELCNNGSCVVLKPVVTVQLPANPIFSPASAVVPVSVSASPSLSLGQLAVEVDTSQAVASGSIDAAANGAQPVTLTQFTAGVSADVSVHATLTYTDPSSGQPATVASVAVPAFLDDAPPTIALSIAPGSDAVNGWVKRDGGVVKVTALIDDGASGSGIASATLSVMGGNTISGTTSDAKTFEFDVPRSVQKAGSDAPVAATVTALDRAGNSAAAQTSLKIDDAPPAIGAFALVSAGSAGEDGRKWFAGGAAAAAVEIAVPVSDSGVGVNTVSLAVNAEDVVAGTALSPAGASQADGWHFLLPASGVQNREGALRFTVTATDLLGHSATTSAQSIFVDDLPPVITPAAVDYASATPAGVCAPDVDACGRTGSRLIRDDTAGVSYDVYDCGAGISGRQTLQIVSGGQTVALKASGVKGASAGCANKSTNAVHHFAFSVPFGTAAPALVSDSSGTALVQLVSSAADVLAQTSQDGSVEAPLSLWRWKRALPGAPSGSPALLPGSSGSRQIALGGGTSLTVLGSDGSVAWSASIASGIAGDLASGGSGAIYAVSPSSGGVLNIVTSGGQQSCSADGASFGASPAIVSLGGDREEAIVAATGGSANLWLFTSADCGSGGTSFALADTFAGVTASGQTALVADAAGFSSIDTSASTPAEVSFTPATPASAPPSIAGSSAIFGAGQSVVRAQCNGSQCTQLGGFASAPANAALPFTPVFDSTDIWTADAAGTLYRWSKSSGGAAQWTLALGSASCSPILLADGSAIAVQSSDGSVVQVDGASSSTTSLGAYGAITGTPIAPQLDSDATGKFGIAYVVNGSEVIALMTPAPPLAAGSNAWPRPGRDSCNSRNAGSSCE